MTHYLFGLVQGLIIGAGAILPGISGASLAVVFGVYEDFTNLIAHPKKTGKAFFSKHASLCVGIGAGFILFTLLLDLLFERFSIVLVFLFIGFIAGTVPGIFKRASAKGIGRGEILAFAVTVSLMIALALASTGSQSLFITQTADKTNIPAFHYQWFFAGASIGAGSLLPGVSASFILIFFGLYGPLLEAVRNRDILILVQLGAGALAALALLSRLVSWLYRHFHGPVSFGVLGFTLGSLILIFPGVPGHSLMLPCTVAAIAGFFFSYRLEKRNDIGSPV